MVESTTKPQTEKINTENGERRKMDSEKMRYSKSYNDLKLIPPRLIPPPRSQASANEQDEGLDGSNHSVKSLLSHLSSSIRSWSRLDVSNKSTQKRNNRLVQGNIDVSEEMLDEKRLYRALQDAGRNADGVSAVEVWILERTPGHGARLIQPPGGFWCSPEFIADDYEALARIEDTKRDDYVYPHPLLPGTGLAGTLWNEKHDSVNDASKGRKMNEPHFRPQAMPFTSASVSMGTPFRKSFQSMTNLHADYRTIGRTVTFDSEQDGLAWRDIHSVTVDPLQPTFLRLGLLEEAGFTKCAGIDFDTHGTKGIVLFLVGDEVTTTRLNVADNVAYMKVASNLVGAAAALTKHRIRLSTRIKQHQTVYTKREGSNEGRGIYNKFATWLGKFRGGDLQPPPPMAFDEAALTFTGVFVTLVALHFASDWMKAITGRGFILGPFGALSKSLLILFSSEHYNKMQF